MNRKKKPMRCLAVKQPWAWALVSGAKDIENRTCSTDYRGPMAILASGSETVVNQISKAKGLTADFPFGAIIGVVDVLDVTPLSEELESNPWASGPYCWRIGNARRFVKSIPAQGKLTLFNLESDLAEQCRIALESSKTVTLNESETTWVDALTQWDDEKARYFALIGNYMELKDFKNALRLAETAVTRWHDARDYATRSLAKSFLGDYTGALEDINETLRIP